MSTAHAVADGSARRRAALITEVDAVQASMPTRHGRTFRTLFERMRDGESMLDAWGRSRLNAPFNRQIFPQRFFSRNRVKIYVSKTAHK
jgi:hypothetical protein